EGDVAKPVEIRAEPLLDRAALGEGKRGVFRQRGRNSIGQRVERPDAAVKRAERPGFERTGGMLELRNVDQHILKGDDVARVGAVGAYFCNEALQVADVRQDTAQLSAEIGFLRELLNRGETCPDRIRLLQGVVDPLFQKAS